MPAVAVGFFIVTLGLRAAMVGSEFVLGVGFENLTNASNSSNETGATPAPTELPSMSPTTTAATTQSSTVTMVTRKSDENVRVKITTVDIVVIVLSVLVLAAIVILVAWRVTRKSQERSAPLFPLGNVQERKRQLNCEKNPAGGSGPVPAPGLDPKPGPTPAGTTPAPTGSTGYKPKYKEPQLEGQTTMYGIGGQTGAPATPIREYSEVCRCRFCN